ncbi:hypothetical protein M514_11368 [Trichuris suis]|uniref:Uncharacterized protein n=1 Tax=Trichuris suis TaxID=68888 RepID=A0A085NDF1_9BILA|nr:hypothetical protein M513_11368 [Trichuris suis]KFD67497.1 hypothetical protein M514_11368 [Trichuris suis]
MLDQVRLTVTVSGKEPYGMFFFVITRTKIKWIPNSSKEDQAISSYLEFLWDMKMPLLHTPKVLKN